MKTSIFLLMLLLNTWSCGTSTGNPARVSVAVRLVDQQPFAWWKPVQDKLLIPSARAAATNVFFCFKRLRFKFDSAGPDGSGNIDLNLGRVAIDPNGTSLGNLSIPAGVYRRIEIDLVKECDLTNGRPSVEFVNLNAPFNYSSQDGMTIKFEGVFTASAGTSLDLNIDLLLDAMDTVTPADNIRDVLEAVTGDY